jgi:CheY-like chemotaxis protein
MRAFTYTGILRIVLVPAECVQLYNRGESAVLNTNNCEWSPATTSLFDTRMSLRILVVEGHPDTRHWMRLLLEALGYSVSVAATLTDAMREVASSRLDVLISNIRLSDGTGWELLKRAGLPHCVLKIAYGGAGTGQQLEQSKAAGFHHYLTLPSALDRLEKLLKSSEQYLTHRISN